jgi:hypothetical protein
MLWGTMKRACNGVVTGQDEDCLQQRCLAGFKKKSPATKICQVQRSLPATKMLFPGLKRFARDKDVVARFEKICPQQRCCRRVQRNTTATKMLLGLKGLIRNKDVAMHLLQMKEI